MEKLKLFFIKSKRVWHALRKPTKKEFWQVAKVSAIGLGILGLAGFIVSMIMQIFV